MKSFSNILQSNLVSLSGPDGHDVLSFESPDASRGDTQKNLGNSPILAELAQISRRRIPAEIPASSAATVRDAWLPKVDVPSMAGSSTSRTARTGKSPQFNVLRKPLPEPSNNPIVKTDHTCDPLRPFRVSSKLKPEGFGRVESASSSARSDPPHNECLAEADILDDAGRNLAHAHRRCGEALDRIVPEVSRFGEGLSKVGRWIRIDDDNALLKIVNKSKPTNGIVSGLSGAHVPGVQSAAIASAAHEAISTAFSSHASATAYSLESRYRNSLKNRTVRDDLRAIKIGLGFSLADVAESDDFNSRHRLVNAIISHDANSHPDGRLDLMRDVLVSRYIADVQGGTRLRSNLYSAAMSLVGMGATAALAAGTKGIAPAAIAGGAMLTGRDVLNNRSTTVSLKQHYRNKKESEINNEMRQRLLEKDGVLTTDALELAMVSARHAVNRQRISKFVPIKFEQINEMKSTMHKKEAVDLVATRATELVMGAIKEANQHQLKTVYTALGRERKIGKRSLEGFYHEITNVNPDLKKACQLMRDLGMAKAEAIAHLRSAVGGYLMQTANADVLDGAGKSGQSILRMLAVNPDASLKSAIGAAMARR